MTLLVDNLFDNLNKEHVQLSVGWSGSLSFSEANVNHHIKGKKSHHGSPRAAVSRLCQAEQQQGFSTALYSSPSDLFLIKPESRESISYGSILALASVSASDLDGFSLILSAAH